MTFQSATNDMHIFLSDYFLVYAFCQIMSFRDIIQFVHTSLYKNMSFRSTM